MKKTFKEFCAEKGITAEQLANKSASELAALHSEYMESVAKELQSAIEAKANQSVIDALNQTLETIKSEHTALATKVKAIDEKPVAVKDEGHKTIKQALFAAFNEPTVKAEIEAIVKAGGIQNAPLKVTVKAVGTMSVASTIGAGSTQVSITQDTGIISPIRKRELNYLANVSVGSIGTNRAMWIEETDEEGTPIMLGEGVSKTQLDVQYVEQTMAVKKIAVYGKVTTELMADIPQLISYINNNLMKRMDIVLEDNLFSGSGVGDNLKGVIAYATAFSAGALAASISDANELDVMEAVALQVKLAYGQPNAIFVHPSTVAKIKLIKDDRGRPVWKDYVTITGDLVISGMRVVESTAITAGDYVGGDMTVVNVLKRDELGIQIGLDGNDFTQNKKTMLIEKRMVQFVSANDTPCLVTGTFADDIADLLVV